MLDTAVVNGLVFVEGTFRKADVGIKDGKIAHPVRGASLVGKGGDILLQIDRVGKNMVMAQGMCGSMSGSVPVNVGQPWIRVKSITVGGRQQG